MGRYGPLVSPGKDSLVHPYNYETFDEHVISGDSGAEMARFPDHLHAGGRAPDAELTRLEGGSVGLSELWARGGVVLEFGSFT